MRPQDKTARYRFGDLRFGMAVPSEIGKRILHDFSPAVMNNEKMRMEQGRKALENSRRFYAENIMPEWQKLIDGL